MFARPACSHAWLAASHAICTERSNFRTDRNSDRELSISGALQTAKHELPSPFPKFRHAARLRPAVALLHSASTESPAEEKDPIPVTTIGFSRSKFAMTALILITFPNGNRSVLLKTIEQIIRAIFRMLLHAR